mgnify:CR=1 FL=1
MWSMLLPVEIPSANVTKRAMYGGNRHAYKAKRKALGWAIKVEARAIPLATGHRRVRVVRLMGKGAQRYDHDNLVAGAKPLLDELTANGLIVGDKEHEVSVAYEQLRAEDGIPGTLIEIRDQYAEIVTMETETEKPKAKKRQTVLPGTEPPTIPELEEACCELFEAREAKKAAADAEKDAEQAVQLALARHDLDCYAYQDGESRWLVWRETSSKVKVERVKKKKRGEAA